MPAENKWPMWLIGLGAVYLSIVISLLTVLPRIELDLELAVFLSFLFWPVIAFAAYFFEVIPLRLGRIIFMILTSLAILVGLTIIYFSIG